MVALRVGSIELGTLDDAAFASVLDAASEVGGPASFPTLFGLTASDEPIDPWLLVDELARLSTTEPGQRVGVLVGTLRDDLMSAVAAADEGLKGEHMTGEDTRQHPADVPDGPRIEMTDGDRQTRPPVGDEKSLLSAFLNYQRDTLLWKVSGLTDEQLRKSWTPTGMSLLGLIKHLAYVERNWFQNRFLMRELPVPWSDADPDADFRIEPDETAASLIAFYRQSIAESKQVVDEAPSLETIAQHPRRPHSLRRILIHMIEETARHNGHADIFRELTDGQTGE